VDCVTAQRIAMALCLVLALTVLLGQVQSQGEFDDDVWDREFDNVNARAREPRVQTVEGCYGKEADIFFILDSSTSIYINDYRQELQFARDVVSRLDIGPRATRVGLLTFSDDITRPPLEINRYQTKGDLLAAITEQNLPYRTGVTNTDLAIRYVRESRLFRENIVKVIVLVTDGGSRSPWLTTREAEQAREQGFYIYVVGVGQYQDAQEWKSVASDPDESFVLNITNFRTLDQIKDILPPRACALPPLDVIRRCEVTRNAEVFFLAAPEGTSNAVQVIDKFVESFVDVNNYVRVSYLLGICNNAENVPVSSLNSYCDRLQVPALANADTYVQLLARVRAIARQSPRETKKVGVLFLDEESIRLNRYGLITEARSVASAENIEIIVVDFGARGVGQNAQLIAPSRANTFSFAPGSLSAQRPLLNSLLERTCTVINGDPFNFDHTPSK
jgi:hypothetical protein